MGRTKLNASINAYAVKDPQGRLLMRYDRPFPDLLRREFQLHNPRGIDWEKEGYSVVRVKLVEEVTFSDEEEIQRSRREAV